MYLLLVMLFLHIIDDFLIQPQSFLANGKQKAWWETNAPQRLYRYDYIVCLLMHSFSWTFMIMLPLALVNYVVIGIPFYIVFFGNVLAHAIVDDMKANDKSINLIQDQLYHIMQIVLTYMVLVVR